MKFAQLLRRLREEGLPEAQDIYDRYKELKKYLKRLKFDPEPTQAANAVLETVWEMDGLSTLGHEDGVAAIEASTEYSTQPRGVPLTAGESRFVRRLMKDVDAYNNHFMDTEEMLIMKWSELDLQMGNIPDNSQERNELKRQLVQLHGEMVLLLHWSMIIYTSVVKILKKHDKQSDLHLKPELMNHVLKQPFRSTRSVSDLIGRIEAHMKTLQRLELEDETDPDASQSRRLEAEDNEDLIMRRTKAAIELWEVIKSTAVTPSTILPVPDSMPPAKRARIDHNGGSFGDRGSKTEAGDSSKGVFGCGDHHRRGPERS
eukprot:jgi/Botrbrau1/2455/Bobra.0226s0014.1